MLPLTPHFRAHRLQSSTPPAHASGGPGTYHHSLMVANLAEDAFEVKANPTLCRACALFMILGRWLTKLFH